MATDRLRTAAEGLVGHLVPINPRESQSVSQERHNRCMRMTQSILTSHQNPSISADVGHTSDLIKRNLINTNPSQALVYSSLYSQLLALPVLKNKWAILHLLSQLAESSEDEEPAPVSALSASTLNYRDSVNRNSTHRHGKDTGGGPDSSRFEEQQFRQAFQTDGLRAFPPPESKQSNNAPGQDTGLRPVLASGNYNEMGPSESVLLRDLPYTLQGLSSTTLPFSGKDTLKLPNTLPLPVVSILHTLAEPSLLYRHLDEFCSKTANGLLGQSLRSGIATELRSYLTLIATLEGQVRRALTSIDPDASRSGIGKAGVTLKRCVIWTREATMGLRMMSLIAEESKERKGGQIISHIHSFSATHGDPVVAAFAERLLATCTRPFYDMLRRWIYDGELSDPYEEFFVRECSADEQHAKSRGASNVWEDKYAISEHMIPSIITQDFAQKVFLIGKSLNFIRHSCGDSMWVENYSKAASKELRYGDTATLEAWIDEAYKTTMKRLMDLMENKFHVFDHLQALKNYMLLGQGDFIALLMESLAANLDRPSGAQYRHTLTAQLEHAIRGSIAQYDSPEVLRRLDARMLQLSHGDIGWDCFTLEYKIDAPVDVVVTEWGNKEYLKVFNFLWRIKRVEFGLLSTWRKCMTGSRGVLQTSDPTVTQTWKSTRGVLAEMIHFVGQLQYYILFEVIESSWGELQKRIRKEDCTLDDMIKAHDRYLKDITHKGLLGPKKRSSGEEDQRAGYLAQLRDLLQFMLDYRDAVNGLYSWSVSDFTRQQQTGVDGMSTSFDESLSSEFPVLQERLRHLGSAFRQHLQLLLGHLAFQPDVDMRFLGVAMNFNEVYQPTRRRTRQPQAGQSAANSTFNTSRA